jgi:hypothetical protein
VVDKPAEILLFDFLTDRITAAAADSVLAELELHDTIWQKITKPRGVRISEAVGDLAPGPGGDMREFDVTVIITCFSRITGKEKKERQPALIDVFGIQKAIAQELRNDSSFGRTRMRLADDERRPRLRQI